MHDSHHSANASRSASHQRAPAKLRPLRAVHTSDVHLGAHHGPSAFAEDHNALSAQAFVRVIDLASERDADLLLIAGDFFDNDRVPEEIIWFAAEEIDRFRGHTVI